ncbi:hypothetical protein Tco_1049961 [Tanacetum coccineum]
MKMEITAVEPASNKALCGDCEILYETNSVSTGIETMVDFNVNHRNFFEDVTVMRSLKQKHGESNTFVLRKIYALSWNPVSDFLNLHD